MIKRIPIAAGLGGGSSDAAAALLGLDPLLELRWARARLAALGVRVRARGAFFLGEAPFAIGRGRGERCEPLPAPRSKGQAGVAGRLPALWHVLAVPPERLATADVYAAWDREAGPEIGLTAPVPSSSMVAHALHNGSLCELA